MFVYPPDVLTEAEAQAYNAGRHWLLDDTDFDILFARHGLIFVGWEPYADSLAHNRFLAEVYPL